MQDIPLDTKSINVILVGMAGSGKTTLMSILAEKTDAYLINLDPACNDPPYSPDIDIRDTVNYKEVMKDYGLGPNGAIVTSLNLYSTKVDQLVTVLQNKQQLTFIDTPGQIEVFTWSASGQVISEALSIVAPTIYLYVVDTARCVENPNTFMANMTYACSILYKTKLPLIIVFTKTDVIPCTKLNQWMDDYDNYLDALNETESYASDLQRSLCLALDDFYKNILHCGVSSKTGEGVDKLLECIQEGKKQFFEDYYQQVQKKKAEYLKKEQEKKNKQFEQFKKDRQEEDTARSLVSDDFCGSAGVTLFKEEDEGMIFRNGERFFFGKNVDDDEAIETMNGEDIKFHKEIEKDDGVDEFD
ncbi:XPA-binding protein, putative [Entamoeba histolytica KU27]|uniref:GPN-loop GTPase n=1 Tax=Entamoeba histolytica KU27 TaxID=885311 RepID=M2RMB4_ENTHI|nr:XPA-binding protein, putative [Entamoeba histolytica KU27]